MQGCGPGYSCQLGMCLVQHPGRGVTSQEEVFPCQDNLECPLNMECNKVHRHMLHTCYFLTFHNHSYPGGAAVPG